MFVLKSAIDMSHLEHEVSFPLLTHGLNFHVALVVVHTRSVIWLDQRILAILLAMVSALYVVLVLVCEVFLDGQVMDAGMHEQVDTDDFIESFHSESIDTLENREEEVAEDHRPDCTDWSSKDLYFELSEAATVDVAQI